MQRECELTERPDVWGVFEARLLAPLLHDALAAPYEQLVERFGFASPAQASNVLMTAKRMFVRAVRATIGEYELEDEQIDEEIADLHRILARGASRSSGSPSSDHTSHGEEMT